LKRHALPFTFQGTLEDFEYHLKGVCLPPPKLKPEEKERMRQEQ